MDREKAVLIIRLDEPAATGARVVIDPSRPAAVVGAEPVLENTLLIVVPTGDGSSARLTV